ncbi:wax ester/triacylglycerol synthase domain-containing protein [Actinomadura welshii]
MTVLEGAAAGCPDLVRHVFGVRRVETVLFNLANPVWVDELRFAIGDHVRHATVPEPGGPEGLQDVASRILADLTRSPWEMWLVDGSTDGHWALACKVHHCMVDGIAHIDLLAAPLDTAPGRRPGVAAPARIVRRGRPARRPRGRDQGLRPSGHPAVPARRA